MELNSVEIIDLIKEYLDIKQDDNKLADFLGVKTNTLCNWKSRNSINYKIVCERIPKLNKAWVKFGVGEMLKTK